MAGEWRDTILGDVIELKRGYDLPSRERKEGRFPIVSSSGISGYHVEAKVKAPGVVTGRYGTIGQVFYITTDFWPLNTALYVRDFKGNDPRFISYFLQTLNFLAYSDKAAVPGLNRNHLHSAPVRVPPLKQQQAIACILGALDDKIELNRTMNRTLEAMARAIFKSWFIDFDPVRAKAAGQKPAGLKPDIAALFPDAFEESELGPIPKGWKITSLADQITASKGLSYKGQYLCAEGEGLPMHNLNSVYEGGGYKHEGLKWYKGEYRPAHLLKPGDVIVTNTEQGFDYLLIGYSAIVPERYGPQGLFSHHLFRIRPKPTSYLPAWFTYLLLRTRRFHDLVAGHSNGTTVNMLPLDGLQKPKFVLPPEALVKRFETLFVPAQQRIEQIHDENASLAALRDTLLPKLISGELVVAEAERIAGRCV